MNIMDAIKKALDMNGNLSSGIKDNIYDLVKIMHEKMPDVDLTNLKNRLATIQFKKINKFLSKDVSMYSNVDNILYFNNEKLNEGYDAKHVLMFEILDIASSTDYKKGFSQEGRFEALNIGYTEILANFLVGNEGEKALYQQQAIETNLISIIVGSDLMRKAYFTNDTEILIGGFRAAGVSV